MPVKAKKAVEKKESTNRLIWILSGVCFAALFMLSISIAFKQTTSAPKKVDDPTIQIDDGDVPDDGSMSVSKQMAMGRRLMRSASIDERLNGMQMVMAANSVEGGRLIVPLLADPDPRIRAFAATMFSTYNVPSMGTQIAALLLDQDREVRQAAAQSLAAYAAEPGLMYQLVGVMSSRDPETVNNAVTVWKNVAPYDLANAPNAIMPALSSNDEDVLAAAVSAISQTYPNTRDLAPYKTPLEGISSRMGESPSGNMARDLLRRLAEM